MPSWRAFGPRRDLGGARAGEVLATGRGWRWRAAAGALIGALALLAGATCGSNDDGAAGGSGTSTRCASTSECADGTVCVFGAAGGRCMKPGFAAAGATCSASRDCAEGLYCSPLSKCAPAGTKTDGDACVADGDCQAGRRCLLDGFSGTCGTDGGVDIGGACVGNNDCLAGLWCVAGQGCQPWAKAQKPFAGAACADDGAFRSYFEVPRPSQPPRDFFRLPFPNDARVTAGQLDIADFPRPGAGPLGVDIVALYADTWVADFEGFGANVPVTFRFSQPLDFASANGEAIHLVDLTVGPTYGFDQGREWGTITAAGKYACANRLLVGAMHAAPLQGGHTYAAYVTTAVRSTAGATPVRDPDLVSALADVMPVGDAALAHAWQAYQPMRTFLADKAIAPDTIANAAVFTVADSVGHMRRLSADVAAQPAPVLKDLVTCGAGVVSPCDDGTPERACDANAASAFTELHGRMSVPIYQRGQLPFLQPEDGGDILESVEGVPQVVRTDNICFALTVPAAPAPATGWPLVVYHPGTGGSMRSAVREGLAERLASANPPVAVLAFDAVEHGARRGDSTKKPDDLVFNPLNPRAARDNFLQDAADTLQALRVATVGVAAGAGVTTPVAFDPARVMFFGHSQGATAGELAMPFAPSVGAVVLSGAGAWLTASLAHKSSPIDIGAGLAALVQESISESHPVMTIFQSFFERSDPLNTNPLLVRAPLAGPAGAKHVWVAWGTSDTYTPAATQRANVQSLGIPLVVPVMEDANNGMQPLSRPVTANLVVGPDGDVARTAAAAQYLPAGYDGHFVAARDAGAIVDWLAFTTTYLTTGTPTVP